jgi:hypothetical protein
MSSNFRVKGKKFQSGYYTLENFGYNLIYTKAFAKQNPNAVNNCGLMLEFFSELPKDATVNVDCKFLEKGDLIINN